MLGKPGTCSFAFFQDHTSIEAHTHIHTRTLDLSVARARPIDGVTMLQDLVLSHLPSFKTIRLSRHTHTHSYKDLRPISCPGKTNRRCYNASRPCTLSFAFFQDHTSIEAHTHSYKDLRPISCPGKTNRRCYNASRPCTLSFAFFQDHSSIEAHTFIQGP